MILVVLVLRGIAEVMALIEDGRDVAAIRLVQTPEGASPTTFDFGNGFEYFLFAFDSVSGFFPFILGDFSAHVVVEQL